MTPAEKGARLEQAITEAVKLASPELEQVINYLQALRGIADISAVTILAELGQSIPFRQRSATDGLLRALFPAKTPVARLLTRLRYRIAQRTNSNYP
jgi:hypothetical protein